MRTPWGDKSHPVSSFFPPHETDLLLVRWEPRSRSCLGLLCKVVKRKTRVFVKERVEETHAKMCPCELEMKGDRKVDTLYSRCLRALAPHYFVDKAKGVPCSISL